MVKITENLMEIDDLGVFPIFLETPTLERMDFMQLWPQVDDLGGPLFLEAPR